MASCWSARRRGHASPPGGPHYLLGDLATTATCYALADPPTRRRIREGATWLPLLPLYRYGVALCRLGGILEACAEPATWRTRDPCTQTRAHAARLLARLTRPAGARTPPRSGRAGA